MAQKQQVAIAFTIVLSIDVYPGEGGVDTQCDEGVVSECGGGLRTDADVCNAVSDKEILLYNALAGYPLRVADFALRGPPRR